MECDNMKFAIATVAFWEALGYDTANWRKSNDGNQAITELKYAEILGVNLAENPKVKIYFGDNPELIRLLESTEWHRDGTNGPFDSYNLLEQLAEVDTRLTTAMANVTEIVADAEETLTEFDVALEAGVVATNIENKLNNLETTYAPELLSVKQQLAEAATKDELSQVASPLVASLAAQMTDTTRVYVYTGAEGGYIAGNWYYHNGTAWVSGGVYQSSGISDGSVTNAKLAQQYSDALTTTVSGSKLYIEDKLANASVGVSATSDYWVGGKNFGVFSDYTATVNGVTITVVDGVITLNGTATANTRIYLPCIFDVIAGVTYTQKSTLIGGSISAFGDATFQTNTFGGTLLNAVKSTLNEASFSKTGLSSASGTNQNIDIFVPSGCVCDNYQFKIQLEIGTVATEWEMSSMPVRYTSAVTNVVPNVDPFYIQSINSVSATYNQSIVSLTVKDYSDFDNKPKINGVELIGNQTLSQLSGEVVDTKRTLPIKNLTLATVTPDGLSSTIAGGTLYPALVGDIANGTINDIYRYNCPVAVKNEFYPAYKAVAQSTPRNLGFVVEFIADCAEFEVKLFAGDRIIISANDVILTDQINTTATGTWRYVKVSFADKQAREIKLYIYGMFFGVLSDGAISKKSITRPLLITDGDSIMEGATVGMAAGGVYGYASIIAQILNFDLYNTSVGGSGYLLLGNQSEPNMVDRYDTYIQPYNPDVLLVSGGLNDSGSDMATVKAQIDAYWSNVKNTINTPYVIVVSPFSPTETPASGVVTITEYLRQAALVNGYPYIDIVNGKTYDAIGNLITDNTNGAIKGIITGTGKAGDVTDPNDGNRYEYISSDNTHPTIAGHRYIGLRVAQEVYKLLKGKAGLI